MENLNIQIKLIKGATVQGFIKSFAFIRQLTEKTPPLTPVDKGNLRASWFVVTANTTPVGVAPKFVGKISGRLTSDHTSAIVESQQEVKQISKEDKLVVMGGYSANYGLYVHENLGAKNWSRPGSGPKWFESAFKNGSSRILEIVKENVKIP